MEYGRPDVLPVILGGDIAPSIARAFHGTQHRAHEVISRALPPVRRLLYPCSRGAASGRPTVISPP